MEPQAKQTEPLNETGRWMTVSRQADGQLLTEDFFGCQVKVQSVMSGFPKQLSETPWSDWP